MAMIEQIAAKDAAVQSRLKFGHGHVIAAAKRDARGAALRQYHNAIIIQQRWQFLKRASLDVPDMPDDDPCEDDVTIRVDDAEDSAVQCAAAVENCNPEETWPSPNIVARCKRMVKHFPWEAPDHLTPYRICGTVLSRAASWHYSEANFEAICVYFDGLEWSADVGP